MVNSKGKLTRVQERNTDLGDECVTSEAQEVVLILLKLSAEAHHTHHFCTIPCLTASQKGAMSVRIPE